jgi:hypothetical protein
MSSLVITHSARSHSPATYTGRRVRITSHRGAENRPMMTYGLLSVRLVTYCKGGRSPLLGATAPDVSQYQGRDASPGRAEQQDLPEVA